MFGAPEIFYKFLSFLRNEMYDGRKKRIKPLQRNVAMTHFDPFKIIIANEKNLWYFFTRGE